MTVKEYVPAKAPTRLHSLWVFAAAFLLLTAIVLTSSLPPLVHQATSGIGLLIAGVAGTAACRYQALRSADRRRQRAWLLFGLSGVIGTAGNVSVFVADMVMGPGSLDKVSSGSLVLALLIGVSATIAFPSTPRRPAEIVRIVMDGVVVGGSLLFFASVTVFPQVIAANGSFGDRALPLLPPVIDVVIATTALLLYLRRDSSDSGFLGLVSIGFGLFSVSDFLFAFISAARGEFVYGGPIDLGWIAGYLVLGLGVRGAFNGSRDSTEVRQETSPVVGTLLMFSVFLVAAVLNLDRSHKNHLSTISAVLWLVVLLGVLGRQISLTLDNESLKKGLEQRVLERTRDLRTATQRSDLLLDSVGDGIYGVDRAGLVTFVNPVGARTLGREPEQLIGLNAHATFHAPEPSGEPFPEGSCYITEALEQGMVTAAEADGYVRADGRVVPVEVTASPTTSDGQAVGAVVVFRDITQRLEVDRMKDEFVSIVSHELRTPLTSIRGSLALLQSGSLGDLSPSALRMATVALDSSLRLGRLIDDILEVERIHSGVLPMQVGEHVARELVDAAVDQVAVVAQQAEVTLQVGSVIGTVFADGDRAQQTLINLLDNAVKFSPAGSAVRVSTRVVGSFLEFAIVDSGRGIPAEKLDTVFKRFEQVDSSDARDRGGTGLGLAISRSIVERLGGRIWAENNATGGSTFRFTLPQADDGALGDKEALSERAVGLDRIPGLVTLPLTQ